MTEEQIERIEQYLNGALSSADKKAFENELRANAELRKQLDFMKSLPKAAQVHAENALRKQLQEFEQTLPKVEIEGKVVEIGAKRSLQGEAPAEQAIPKSISGFHWARYAAAASILLIVGLFIFRDDIFRVRDNTGQLAQANSDSASSINGSQMDSTAIMKSEPTEWQFATTTTDVALINDRKMGFVNRSLKTRITVIQEYYAAINVLEQREGEFYRFHKDTLFITGKLYGTIEHIIVDSIKIVESKIAEERGQKLDSLGQLVEYDKPGLNGLFVLIESSFYKIRENENYAPLIKVKQSEAELLKFYTR